VPEHRSADPTTSASFWMHGLVSGGHHFAGVIALQPDSNPLPNFPHRTFREKGLRNP